MLKVFDPLCGSGTFLVMNRELPYTGLILRFFHGLSPERNQKCQKIGLVKFYPALLILRNVCKFISRHSFLLAGVVVATFTPSPL